MDKKWQELIKQVRAKQSPAASWKSDQKSLEAIFRFAGKNEIDPVEASGTDISKLRTIIKEAKDAIKNNDLTRLDELFHLAANSTIVELRLRIGTTTPEVIMVEKVLDHNATKFNLSLFSEEFERFQQSTRLFFQFSVTETIEAQA